MKNILDMLIRFRHDVYILAPGWNGLSVHHKIKQKRVGSRGDRGSYVIAVNKAVMIPFVEKDYWLAEDMGMLTLHPWFEQKARDLIKRGNEDWSLPIPVFGKGAMTDYFPDVPYYYESGASIGHRPSYEIIDGVLRGGATIASKAVQFAVQKGAKRIVLVGVDMMGRKYYDGTESVSTSINEQGEWWCLSKWEQLLKNVRKREVEVVSLSETALDVPVVEE